MTTAYAANVQYGPGSQVTSGGKTYVHAGPITVENIQPPAAPWIEQGTATGAQSVHIANAVADGALTGSAPAALTGATVSTANATDLATSEALANALKTAVNANVADLVALRTTIGANVTDIATLRTAVNALVGVVNTLLADLQSAGLMSAT